MTVHTIYNSQSLTVSTEQWDGDGVVFGGSSDSAGETPTVTFAGHNALTNIDASGSAALPGFGFINLSPRSSLSTTGLTVIHSTLFIREGYASTIAINGTSSIGNGSTLTATGSGGLGRYDINGTINIDGSSTVNMDYVAVTGSGIFHLMGEDALLRAGSFGAGNTVVLDGGMLSLTNGMDFLGTITDSAPAASRIGPISSVAVYNAMGAVQETFDRTTGVLGLFDASGAQLANLKFAGSGDLYATRTNGLSTNYVSITSHPSAGALPVSFIG